jgi:hypothetical protein
MCDPELIAAILEELGYLDEKKERTRRMNVVRRKVRKTI